MTHPILLIRIFLSVITKNILPAFEKLRDRIVISIFTYLRRIAIATIIYSTMFRYALKIGSNSSSVKLK